MSVTEAKAAQKRRIEHQHNMAIEGIELSPADLSLLDQIDREQMGYDEGVRFVIDRCIQEGLIPTTFNSQAAEAAE